MAQLLSKEDLIEKSKKYFGYHKSVTLFFATQDGQFFTEAGQARSHNEKVVKGEVVKIEKVVAFPPLVQEEAEEGGEEADMEALRAEYENLSGEKAGSRIKKETLIQRIEELKKEAE